eukprot:TRINITY_DN10294_c0_g1_i1.p1 TRINITY_DN10294_c0_g1~~TRINITY_DN10294_c0_g1_i1.p1  ORF type:complete len:269 (+),score=42.61 TRINITY_DN10294_c0_g1_i1:142-948(+)
MQLCHRHSGSRMCTLLLQCCSWAATQAVKLGPATSDLELAKQIASRQQSSPDSREQAYLSLMKSLDAWGVLSRLPLDASGVLHFSAPFCHDFAEATMLLPFLSARVLGGGASGIFATGCDVKDQPFWWRLWEQWTSHTLGPRVRLQLQQRDLERERPASAALIIAAHPEVTNGGPWPAILANVLRSRVASARCVITTFYRQEAEAAARICQAEGSACEIRENPFYAGHPPDEVGTFHRFAVICAPGPEAHVPAAQALPQGAARPQQLR